MRQSGAVLGVMLVTSIWAGCGGFVGPEFPELGSVAGAGFHAELEVTQDSPTQVRVRVIATNPTSQRIDLSFDGTGCSVIARVYGEHVDGQFILPGRANACPLILGFLTLAPGESKAFPDEPEFLLAERLGAAFRPGDYVISAVIEVGPAGEEQESFELLAGRVRAR